MHGGRSWDPDDYFGQAESAPGTQNWTPNVPESASVTSQQSPVHASQLGVSAAGPSHVCEQEGSVQEEDEPSLYCKADDNSCGYWSDSSETSSYYSAYSYVEDVPGSDSPRWPSHYPHIPKLDFSFLQTARSASSISTSTTFRSALHSWESSLGLVRSSRYATCRSDPDFVDLEANIIDVESWDCLACVWDGLHCTQSCRKGLLSIGHNAVYWSGLLLLWCESKDNVSLNLPRISKVTISKLMNRPLCPLRIDITYELHSCVE